MKKLVLVSLLLGVCSVANAGAVWLTNLTINSYRWYWDGTNTVVEVEVKEPVTTNGCAPSDYNAASNPYPRFAHWYPGVAFQAHSQDAISTLMAAEAQGKKIDILYENTTCSGTSGRQIWGVKVRSSS